MASGLFGFLGMDLGAGYLGPIDPWRGQAGGPSKSDEQRVQEIL